MKAASWARGSGSVEARKKAPGLGEKMSSEGSAMRGKQGSLGAGRCNEGAERGSAGRGYQAAKGR